MSACVDFKKKIEFAEHWLDKAKHELNSGSSTDAASHVLLAIAEMETLKNAMFGVQQTPLNLYKPKRSTRIDIRPVLAAAMFFLALSLFMSSSRYEPLEQLPVLGLDATRYETLIGDLSERSVFDSIRFPELRIPLNDSLPQNETTVSKPVVPSKSKISKTGIKRPETSSAESSGTNSNTTVPLDNDLIPSSVSTPSWDFVPSSVDYKLNPDAISMEAIIVARESLYNEE